MRRPHRIRFLPLLLVAALSCAPICGSESTPPDSIQNAEIAIKYIDGVERSPFQTEKAKAVALLFVTQDCPISNAYAPELARIHKEYSQQGFDIALVYVDPDVSDEAIRKHRSEYSLAEIPAIADRTHALVTQAGATITPEAVVALPDGTIAYRGRIDNGFPSLGQRRHNISQRDLRNALDAIADHKPVPVPRTQAVGCYVPSL